MMCAHSKVAAMVYCASLVLLAVAASPAVVAADSADAQLNGLDGVWVPTRAAGQALTDMNGNPPPLVPAAAQLYQKTRTQLAHHDRSFDPAVKCKPMGFPRVLWDGGSMDIQVQPALVLFGYTWNRNHRIVDIGPTVPAVQLPRYYGVSAAHWDGDTLVVESAGYRDTTLLDSAGLPHSQDMKLSERYQPLDAGRKLQVRITIQDAKYYTKPWDVAVAYVKAADAHIVEDVCELHAPAYKGLFPGNN